MVVVEAEHVLEVQPLVPLRGPEPLELGAVLVVPDVEAEVGVVERGAVEIDEVLAEDLFSTPATGHE